MRTGMKTGGRRGVHARRLYSPCETLVPWGPKWTVILSRGVRVVVMDRRTWSLAWTRERWGVACELEPGGQRMEDAWRWRGGCAELGALASLQTDIFMVWLLSPPASRREQIRRDADRAHRPQLGGAADCLVPGHSQLIVCLLFVGLDHLQPSPRRDLQPLFFTFTR
jgi:hypothetical protein